ncbi:MAG TPA: DUF3098 domain-containing protein [Bacteroidia bacterium]|nr:DUF3098 domain-containing protein [Bacteroidia bacterium]HNU32311.1 DUF3098 domain-containing protein [Bacteroidia bacterium]
MAKEKVKVSAASKTPGKAITKPVVKSNEQDLAFGKINYMLMIAGILLLIIGYAMMSGGGSNDPNVFNPEIFSFRRITLAPIIVLLGYGLEVLAIVIKAKD